MAVTVSDIAGAIERVAPLHLQEEYDNAGLQVGFADAEVRGVLVSLDVTEDVVDEAVARCCNVIISHHPLLFRGLKQVSDTTYQQRCVVKALAAGVSIYSAHTNLDNARGGVNYRIASILGVRNLEWLSPKPSGDAGSGVTGNLEEPVSDVELLERIRSSFGVRCLMHTEPSGRSVSRIAICGGAGAFLLNDARLAGADCFITGELHYHDYFESDGMLLVGMGHYQSEKFTIELLAEIISGSFPAIEVKTTGIDTNPIRYSL